MVLDCTKGINAWLVRAFGRVFGLSCKVTPPTPPPPIAWDHVIGAGMFLGLYPWKGNGIYNDAPRDMVTLVTQFAKAGGNLMQFQLMYQDGALFVPGQGLTMDTGKVLYCKNLIAECRKQGVGVLLVLFDHCTLKYSNLWSVSPLNFKNGGPFGAPFDLYKHSNIVAPYVREVVAKLGADNVAYEIINEGSDNTDSKQFGGQIRDTLNSISSTVLRISTSGANPGGLWRTSPHGAIHASNVKYGQLPNTDGQTWDINDVPAICAAVRATPECGLVFDGVADAKHNWAAFLNALK